MIGTEMNAKINLYKLMKNEVHVSKFVTLLYYQIVANDSLSDQLILLVGYYSHLT